jgi:hypothetical protein
LNSRSFLLQGPQYTHGAYLLPFFPQEPFPVVEPIIPVEDHLTILQAPFSCTLSTMSDYSTTYTHITPDSIGLTIKDPLEDIIFHSDEHILKSTMTPDYPWDDMHHHSFFLPSDTFLPTENTIICVVETKDFISFWAYLLVQKPNSFP